MVIKALPGIKDFIRYFKQRFIALLISVIIVVYRSSGKVYQETGHHFNIAFWITLSVMYATFNLVTFVFFRADFDLINGAATQFAINGDELTITTASLKMRPLLNRQPMELKLTIGQFARSRTIYPLRIFPLTKFSCWEVRTNEKTVYVIDKFFSPEGIAELENFLYWKNLETHDV